MRIVVAMSGGVDSSVAAALLVDAGHDVVGLSMQLYDQREGEARFGTCCSIDDLHDARRVAAHLGIPHYIVNFEDEFQERVMSRFVREYVAGRTPIPCVQCNVDLKFRALLARARGLGAAQVATGHYARVERQPGTGRCILRRGVDRARDQSYFLFSLDQEQLAGAIFPLGEMAKADVRAYARRRELPVAGKPESREICFVPDGDTARFVARHAESPPQPGLITDGHGRILGRHGGVHAFTVGQRKRLGLASPVPMYVVRIDAERSTVVVGSRDALERRSFEAADVNWPGGAPPERRTRVGVQIRYQHREASATLTPIADGSRVRVEFDEAQSAIAPGQAAVFYDGDEVVGGGWIE
jgi:tRNA-specific 2-thiouridylase